MKELKAGLIEYHLYFTASNPTTGEVYHDGYYCEFYASNIDEARECCKDIISAIYDNEGARIYEVEFTSATSAKVFALTDEEYNDIEKPELIVLLSDIEPVMSDVCHNPL